MSSKKKARPSTMEEYVQQNSSEQSSAQIKRRIPMQTSPQTRAKIQKVAAKQAARSPQTRAMTQKLALSQASPKTREMLKGLFDHNPSSSNIQAQRQLLSEQPSSQNYLNSRVQPEVHHTMSLHMLPTKQPLPHEPLLKQDNGQPQTIPQAKKKLKFLAQGQLQVKKQGQTSSHVLEPQVINTKQTEISKQPLLHSPTTTHTRIPLHRESTSQSQFLPIMQTQHRSQPQNQLPSQPNACRSSNAHVQVNTQTKADLQRQHSTESRMKTLIQSQPQAQPDEEHLQYKSQKRVAESKRLTEPEREAHMEQPSEKQGLSRSNHTSSHIQSGTSQSLNQSEDLEHSSADHTTMKIPIKKKGRGLAKGYKGWGTGEILELEFNELGQSIGPNAPIFASQLGVLARCGTRLPLNIISWAHMPDAKRDNVWEEIKENTNASDDHKDTCMMRIGDLWKKWKAEVKKFHYTPYEDDLEKLAEIPQDHRIRPDQWNKLVKYWQIEKVKAEAKANKEHRGGLRCVHRTGRKSFATIRNEMEEKNEDVSRVSVFLKTREPPENKPRHKDSDEVMAKMRLQLEQVPESERTPEFMESIYKEVLGPEEKHRRVRTFGIGPSPTDIFKQKSASTSEQIQRLVDEKVKMMLSEYEKEHKEKLMVLDDLEKQQKAKLETADLMLQRLNAEMVRQGLDYEGTALNHSSAGQVNTNGSVVGVDNLHPTNPNSKSNEDID